MVELLVPFKLFSPEECQAFITNSYSQELKLGQIHGYGLKSNIRNNSMYWFNIDKDLKDKLWNLAQIFKYKYAWTWFQEPIQISKYAPGEFYDWHDDIIPNRSSKRCLTLTCTLQPAPGAVFEVEGQTFNLDQGWAIFFDSSIKHKAHAPNSGERWAFTVWYMMPT